MWFISQSFYNLYALFLMIFVLYTINFNKFCIVLGPFSEIKWFPAGRKIYMISELHKSQINFK